MRKSVAVGGKTISFLEKNSQASKCIFFVHGNSASARIWHRQFNSDVLNEYRLIAFDLPAHGCSDVLEEEQYNLPYMAALLADAVKQLSANRTYLLVGFCYGANMVAEMLCFDLNPVGVCLFSPNVLGEGYGLNDIGLEGADMTPFFTHEASESDVKACLQKAFTVTDVKELEEMLEDYCAVKAPFRTAIIQTYLQGKIEDEINLLKKAQVPLLVAFGKNDRVNNIHYLDNADLPLWKNTLFKVDNGSHFLVLDQHETVNRLLASYAADVVKGDHALVRS